LKDLGYNLEGKDLNWNHPMPQDALGLSRFQSPAYPENLEDCQRLENEWKTFRNLCQLEIVELQQTQQRLEAEMVEANAKRIQQLVQAGAQGQMINPLPPLALKAAIKLKYLVEGSDGHLGVSYQRKGA